MGLGVDATRCVAFDHRGRLPEPSNLAAQLIRPPGFDAAYLVRNFGANLGHAGTGTVFVVMHSCRGGALCPGNYLIDVAAGTASVKIGADVSVNGLHYRVTGWKKVYKPDVHSDASVWANTPGRLVLFTCLQIPAQTESIDNMIITAQLVKPATRQNTDPSS